MITKYSCHSRQLYPPQNYPNTVQTKRTASLVCNYSSDIIWWVTILCVI